MCVSDIILKGKKQEPFPLRSGEIKGCQLSLYIIGRLSQRHQTRGKNNDI